MNRKNYTLRELSEELDISLRDLKKHIGTGTLRTIKSGRYYIVSSTDLDDFIESETKVPERNYLCQNYDKCLDKAARSNRVFSCEGCKKFKDAGSHIVFPLWDSVFGAAATATC